MLGVLGVIHPLTCLPLLRAIPLIFTLSLVASLLPGLTLAATAPITDDGSAFYTTNLVNQQTGPVAQTPRDRFHAAMNYLKSEVPHLLPGLPGQLKSPGLWIAGQAKALVQELEIDRGVEALGMSGGQIVSPVAHIIQPPSESTDHGNWLSPSYHHKSGMLPTHDAVVMGFSQRHSMLGNSVRIETRPFYAQNPLSGRGYIGGDLAINLMRGPDENGKTGKSWGKIALGYVAGDQSIMDDGHGFAMHSELQFNDHLALHAGMRENHDSNSGAYVMMRWVLAGD